MAAAKCQSVCVTVNQTSKHKRGVVACRKERRKDSASNHQDWDRESNNKHLKGLLRKKNDKTKKNWRKMLWQRGELTFRLTDLNVHVLFVT